MAAALRCERRWKEKRTFLSKFKLYMMIHCWAQVDIWNRSHTCLSLRNIKRSGRRRSRFCVTPEVIHMRFSKHISRPIQLRRWDNRPSQAETRAFALRHLQQIFLFFSALTVSRLILIDFQLIASHSQYQRALSRLSLEWISHELDGWNFKPVNFAEVAQKKSFQVNEWESTKSCRSLARLSQHFSCQLLFSLLQRRRWRLRNTSRLL